MLQDIWDSFYDAFNLGGLFDIIKTIFYAVLIIIAIVIVAYVVICITGSVIEWKKKKKAEQNKKKAEQKYIDDLKGKYAKCSKGELAEIYNDLISYKKSMNNAKEAEKKKAYAISRGDRDELKSLLVSQIAAGAIRDVICDKYRISIEEQYFHHDMAYLKKQL